MTPRGVPVRAVLDHDPAQAPGVPRGVRRLRPRRGRGVRRRRRRAADGRRRHRAQPREDRGGDRQRPRRASSCPDGLDDAALVVRAGPRPARPGRSPTCRRSPPESTALAKALKKRGFGFVGPTTAYALMQATGMVDDHLDGCHVADRPMTVPVIEVSDLRRSYVSRTGIGHRSYEGRRGGPRASTSRSSAASCSACSGPTAPARPRRSRCSSPCCCRPAGTARVLGHDVVERRRARSAGGSATSSAATGASTSGSPALDNLRYFAELYGVPARDQQARIGELLELVGLNGREQRTGRGLLAGHAAAPAHRPRPAAPARGAVPRRAEHRHRPGRRPRAAHRPSRPWSSSGTTVLLTTHYMFEADELCDRIAVIAGGQIVAERHPGGAQAGVADGSVVEIEVFGVCRRRRWPTCARCPASRSVLVEERGQAQVLVVRVGSRAPRSPRPCWRCLTGAAGRAGRHARADAWRTPTSSWSATVRHRESVAAAAGGRAGGSS